MVSCRAHIQHIHRNIYRVFLRSIEFTWKKRQRLPRMLFIVCEVALLALLTILVVDLLGFYLGDHNLGTFGDFFGGALNPILSFLTFMGLVVTILIQKSELSLVREEYAKTVDSIRQQNFNLEVQRFENTFFKILEMFERCRSDVSYERNEARDALKNFLSYTIRLFDKEVEYINQNNQKTTRDVYNNHYDDIAELSSRLSQADAKSVFSERLGIYYSTLFRLMKFVDDSDVFCDHKQKKVYIEIIGSQFSTQEIILLTYCCMSTYGSKELYPLCLRYDFFWRLEARYFPGNQGAEIIKKISGGA